MFKLVIQDDEGKTTVVPLIRDEITIGRKEGNTIRLTERNVSRRHAKIVRNNGEVSIEDLGSYNGIRVNNARIAERVALRVSDQVQIGDYKLYLKAEGVEQVDDARTVPIERIDTAAHTTPTDTMAAQAAPTAPIPVPQVAGTLPPNAQLVGDPKRTLVAVADTDPQGRPLASPAALAAIAQPVGHGKLVVLSSNFAGKEFELTRPQMIIGRTDENDIVVNHRSISRNHAKIVREPDTGRYTISDLQSSNGVRVNGNDYGKVELRRGDVVDLGHVRLRFVEPGEDFVFSRDAVITDVPETGGKKGLLVAIVLGMLVLAGVVVFFLMKGGDDGKQQGAGPGTNGQASIDAGDKVAIKDPPLADAAEANPTPDAEVSAANNPQMIECAKFKAEEKWVELSDCAGKLKAAFPTEAADFSAIAGSEGLAEAHLRKITNEAAKTDDLKLARQELAKIDENSVYRKRATTAVEKIETKLVDDAAAAARGHANRKDCTRYETRLKQLETAHGADLADRARDKAGTCKAVVADNNNNNNNNNNRPDPPKGCTADSCGAGMKCEDGKCVKKPEPPCDFAGAKARGDAALQASQHALALKEFDAALRCQLDMDVVKKAFLSACNVKNEARAKALYPTLPASSKGLKQRCVQNGMDPSIFP